MCGIAGVLSLNGEPFEQVAAVRAMARSLSHRGPDDEGYVLVGCDGDVRSYRGEASADLSRLVQLTGHSIDHIRTAMDVPSRLALGHRRLSIIDVSALGHQPMCSRDGRYALTYNGEIYNYTEIRAELAARGHAFQSNSDTEVLLHAYIEWGPRALDRLNGDFAVAIWDNVEQTLFCARDRIGIKPFYYTIQNGQFVFGSDIKAIIASGLYDPSPDPEGLYLAMAFGIAPRPITAFRAIRALEQGTWMRIYVGGRIERQRYWQIPTGEVDATMREGETVELLEEKLRLAVRRRLVADVPVATFMSGGIDSTTVSSIAAQVQPGIHAFTLGFSHALPELDEVAEASATARLHPMRHVVHRTDPAASLANLDSWIAGYEEPWYSLDANQIIARRVSAEGIKVTLNGVGGDELFAGYRYYRQRDIWRAVRLLRGGLRPMLPLFGRRARMLSRLAQASTVTGFHTAMFSHFGDEDLTPLFGGNLLPTQNLIEHVDSLYANGRAFANDIDAISYMDMMNYLGNHHLHRIDQFTMAHSIEGRFPYLDHEVVELAFRIPAHLKIRGKEQKYVLRRVAAGLIAPACLTMKKKGFSLPLKDWMQGPLKELVVESLRELKKRDVVRPSTVDRFWEEYTHELRGPTDIWHLVALELWFRRFIDPGKQSTARALATVVTGGPSAL